MPYKIIFKSKIALNGKHMIWNDESSIMEEIKA